MATLESLQARYRAASDEEIEAAILRGREAFTDDAWGVLEAEASRRALKAAAAPAEPTPAPAPETTTLQDSEDRAIRASREVRRGGYAALALAGLSAIVGLMLIPSSIGAAILNLAFAVAYLVAGMRLYRDQSARAAETCAALLLASAIIRLATGERPPIMLLVILLVYIFVKARRAAIELGERRPVASSQMA